MDVLINNKYEIQSSLTSRNMQQYAIQVIKQALYYISFCRAQSLSKHHNSLYTRILYLTPTNLSNLFFEKGSIIYIIVSITTKHWYIGETGTTVIQRIIALARL